MSGNQGQPDVQCLVCTRPFTLDTEVTDSFEALAICRECKMTVLSDNNRDDTTITYRERRRRRPRSRATRHGPVEDTFSQQFSQLINLARQGHEADIDSPIVVRQQASYTSTPNRSQRWYTSDDESDSLNYVDSVFGEIESNISFGDYGGDSDASLDNHTAVGRDIAMLLDNGSYMNTDTDFDPMNAGIDQWDSDDPEDDEDEQSEESDLNEAADTMHLGRWHDIAPIGLTEQDSEDTIWTWRLGVSQGVNNANSREESEGPQIRRHFVGNPGDYADARQFQMLLEQFSEDNNPRRGAPPTATSFIEILASTILSTIHDTSGSVICAVCKDPMPIGTRAKQLPCMHLYHSSCILPWLSSRNTCPVCRYELPTDDPEYERAKRAARNERDMHGMGHTRQQEIVEETADEVVAEGAHHTVNGTEVEDSTDEHAVHAAQQPDRGRGRTRWLFIAAAPVAREDKEEVEEARDKRSPAYFALWQHSRDEENPTGDEEPSEARLQQLHLHRLPSFSSVEEDLCYIIAYCLETGTGPVFLYSTGAMEILHVAQPEMVKDMGHWTPSELVKPQYLKKSRKPLFGEGILSASGDLWAYERKILAPEFYLEKIKGMIGLIEDATVPVLQAWENILDSTGGSKEIYVDRYLRNFSADVIARACFGSSFAKGKDIFCKIRQLQKAISQLDTFVGLSALWKYLPTKINQEIQRLEQEIQLLILEVSKEQRDRSSSKDGAPMSTYNSLLHSIINGADESPRYSIAAEDFIVDNCKNIYFAGHETAALTATWCLMLLAANPDWQDRARAEVLEVCCGRTILDIDVLRQLKILTMVIQETLRLYPPASLIMREARMDIRLGGVDVPRGTIIQVTIPMLHLDMEAWGPDAGEFRPERFANGAAAACKPAHMYMPFGYGPRLCTGQNLAMAELKVILARLLSKFSFSMSPGYQHMPAFRLTIEPEFGMPLVVTKLS